MKKRCTAILLAAVLALSLLPVQVFATETVPEGWTPIYTLADLQDAIDGGVAKKLILMNDIDADKEDLTYNYLSDEFITVADEIREDMILDGNGHTIYNLKTTLLRFNQGTVTNLNTTIHDTPDDEEHLRHVYSDSNQTDATYLCGIALTNFGTIENCRTRFTLQGEGVMTALSISGIANSNRGTIRDCIVAMDVDYHINGPFLFMAGIAHYNYSYYSYDTLIDHCLVLGTLIGSGADYGEAVGLASLQDAQSRCVDSACALEMFSMVCDSGYHFSPAFQTWSSSIIDVENCRVASDMKFRHVVTDDNFDESGTFTADDGYTGGYTLASRASILADWDLSSIPGEAPGDNSSTEPAEPVEPDEPDETAEDPFPAGTATFHFSGNSGKKEEWSFYYANSFFYSQDKGYGYNADLAKASLCVEMASFSDCENLCWNETLPALDTRRATNIRELYSTLGFTNAQYVNYDKPLTDTSDKVAYSMAVKYIDNGKGGKDTLVVLPIRGGNYGGEWSSNFHLFGNTTPLSGNHAGFQTAAEDVKKGLDSYVKNLDIQGDLKLWVVGYSRAAAVANILGRILNNSTVGGVSVSRSDIYVYTFATPAGASYSSAETIFDPNIFNIVSPVDLVPRVAPAKWEFARYGTTLTLPSNNYDFLWKRYREISSLMGQEIKASQRTVLDIFCKKAFTLRDYKPTLFGGVPYIDVQKDVMNAANNMLGKNQSQEISGATVSDLIVTFTLTTISEAHFVEYYLARLESDVLCSEEDFAKASRIRSVLFYPPDPDQSKELDIDVDFWNASQKSAGSYVSGMCTSGEVAVEMTDLGLVATFPAGKDYTFTLAGAGADSVNFTIFTYDSDTPDGPARTMNYTDYSLENDTYTVYVPEDPYDDYYVEDQDGYYYVPDYDSLEDGELPDEELPVVEVTFTDVSPDAYYYDAVLWAVENGITSGTSATTFSPNAACTRAQAVTFLWRAAGSPQPESTRNPSTDVKAGSYYYDAVLWAAEEGITSGTSATTFSPNATCTRAQIVTFLYRSMGSPDVDVQASFRDVPAGAYYADAVSWAADWGVTSGTSATTFSPNASCTRAQIVTFLYRT